MTVHATMKRLSRAIVLAMPCLLPMGALLAEEIAMPSDEEAMAIFDALNESIAIPPVLSSVVPRSATRALSAAAGTCGMGEERQLTLFEARVGEAVARKRYKLLFDNRPATSSVFTVINRLAVNIDGSPRTYHPEDIYGDCTFANGGGGAAQECAINFLCNGGVHIFEGGKKVPCSRKEGRYRPAWEHMWVLIRDRKLKPLPQQFWEKNPQFNAAKKTYGYYDPQKRITVTINGDIISKNSTSYPCMRDAAGAKYAGYLVNSTALSGDEKENEPEGRDRKKIVKDEACDPIPYVDPEQVKSIVIPKTGFAGAKVGDVAVGYLKGEDGSERFVLGVVGDTGPGGQFGEASVSFNAALRGKTPANGKWRNYKEVLASHIEDEDKPERFKIGMLIIRNTSEKLAAPVSKVFDLSQANLAKVTEAAFAKWGGGDRKAAEKRFKACMSAAME